MWYLILKRTARVESHGGLLKPINFKTNAEIECVTDGV